jgi:hypothetical protein
MVFNALFYFSYIVAVSFIDGENSSTRWKLPTGHKDRIRTFNISGDRHCLYKYMQLQS